MENERVTVPPGIGPKLPEPPPPAQPKNKLTSREILLAGAAGVLILALAVWFIVFAVTAGRTPKQVVDAGADEGMAVQEELVLASLPGSPNRYVYFYIAGEKLACALLEHRASGYKVLDAVGGLPLTGADKPGVWKMQSPKNMGSAYYVFGLLYDDTLSVVEVDGEPATVVDTGVYRLWYFFGEDLSINSESVVYR